MRAAQSTVEARMLKTRLKDKTKIIANIAIENLATMYNGGPR